MINEDQRGMTLGRRASLLHSSERQKEKSLTVTVDLNLKWAGARWPMRAGALSNKHSPVGIECREGSQFQKATIFSTSSGICNAVSAYPLCGSQSLSCVQPIGGT